MKIIHYLLLMSLLSIFPVNAEDNMTYEQRTQQLRKQRDAAITQTAKLTAPALIDALIQSLHDQDDFILNAAEQEIIRRLKNKDTEMQQAVNERLQVLTGREHKTLSRILKSSKPRSRWSIGWF